MAPEEGKSDMCYRDCSNKWGLDSARMERCLKTCPTTRHFRRDWTSPVRTVVFSIHHPSYRIFDYISDYLILSRGLVIHFGNLVHLEDLIAKLGFQIPEQLNQIVNGDRRFVTQFEPRRLLSIFAFVFSDKPRSSSDRRLWNTTTILERCFFKLEAPVSRVWSGHTIPSCV
ncbi:Uncharacterized protein Rs2_06813 [Raphanus sativus]|nr:Uncharacterized protein Rs2_06813 [Raphanus sativus]